VFICGLLIVAIVSIVLFERARGARKLNAVLAELKASKVELDVGKIANAKISDSENAAVALLKITNQLQSFSLPQDVGPIPLMKLTAPGQAASFIASETWPDSSDESHHHWDDLKKTHIEALLLLEQIVAISKLPRFASPLDTSKGVADMQIPSLSVLPSVMRVLRLVAAYDLHHRNDERAAEAVITLLDIFPNKSEDTWIIAELVRCSFSRLAMSLTWELLQHAKLRTETWERLQSAWERCEFKGHYAKPVRTEISGISDYFIRLKASAAYRMNIIGKFEQLERDFGALWSPLARGVILQKVHLPIWRLLWADQDHAYSINFWETEVRLADFAITNDWNSVVTEAARLGRPYKTSMSWEEKSLYDRARYLFSFSPQPLIELDLARVFQAETEARLAVTAIALNRYELARENYPKQLAALTPEFLPEVPVDPMDGTPLKYSRLDNGEFLLYSSGANGRDDNASTEPHQADGSAPTLWNAADVIWPRRID
jgi:hypothetical protein